MIQTTDLGKIKQTLQNGNLCVIPTDTILGIFASASNNIAVRKVYTAKQRETNKPLAIFLPNITEIHKFAIETEASKEFTHQNLPGAYTILLQASTFARQTLAPELISQSGTIGIRIPKQNDILQITQEIIICGTSVNVSGQEFARMEIPPEILPFVSAFYTSGIDNMKQVPSQILDFSQNSIVKIR